MIVLELSFPAGRYHATPWGRHVNEGAVEWPPSPWRVLRALIATWHLKAKEEIPRPVITSLVEKLSVLPRFRLPPATTSHTRHYMPYNVGKSEKTTKVFDSFIQLEAGSVMLVAWDADLEQEELTALKKLARRLGYFGRSEAIVEGRVLEGVKDIDANAVPSAAGALTPRTEFVRLLVPIGPDVYAQWRDEFMSEALSGLGAKPTAGQKQKLHQVPENLFDALHADTGELQAAGWNSPPGAQFVDYTRLESAFAPTTRPTVSRAGPLPKVARYAVVSDVPPSIKQAVSVGDRVHDALCKWSDTGDGAAPVFMGRDAGKKSQSNHRHAHVFCEPGGSQGAITHITVWADMGFDEAACLALRRLNKVWGHGGHDIRLVLHGIGQPENFEGCALFGTAKAWKSLTPFVSTRHAKTFRDGRPKLDQTGWQIGSSGHDLLRLLRLHLKGAEATIREIPERELPFSFGSRRLRSLEFQTIRRNGGGKRGHSSGNAFTIEFSEAVSGPLAFGYGSHFGLGLFVPA